MLDSIKLVDGPQVIEKLVALQQPCSVRKLQGQMPKILAAVLPLLESKFIPHAAHPCPFLSALSLSALLPIHQLPLSLSLAARPTLGAPASSSSERASRPPLADRASGRRSLPPSPPPRAQPGRASSSSGAGSVPQREGTDGGRGGAGAGEVPQPNGARRQRGASVEPSRGGWVDADGEPAAEGPGPGFTKPLGTGPVTAVSGLTGPVPVPGG